MRIGFYAPLKSPNHDVPSGDRKMARLLIKALEAAGHNVELLSELRSWNGTGSIETQQNIKLQAETEVERLKQLYAKSTPPDLIFTYHVYHKAPDWIGIELADHLSIPYIIVETSYAPKQLGGPWDSGHQQTLKCIQQAKTIISLNPVDVECIKPLTNNQQNLELLKPFLSESPSAIENQQELKVQTAATYKLDISKVWLVTVAMMREGDKQKSYQQLAQTLRKLEYENWQMLIIGDGNANEKIRSYFSDFSDRCLFLGKLEQNSIFEWLSISDIFVWPAVNEAFGLATLEAQACGLPVVVQDFGGVSTIVENEKTGFVTNPTLKDEFTFAIEKLIDDKLMRQKFSVNARNKFMAEHSFDTTCKKVNKIIYRVSNT